MRAKRKGDALMAHKKYTKAIKAYEEILRKDEKDRMGIQLAGIFIITWDVPTPGCSRWMKPAPVSEKPTRSFTQRTL